MAQLLNGRETSRKIKEKLAIRVESIKEKGINPHMAIIRVGDDPASIIYLRHKKKACESIGIKYSEILLPETISEKELIKKIREVNGDESIHGLIVQFPLPEHISKTKIIREIDPKKDVDGLHPINTMKMYEGEEGLRACTPLGIITLLKHHNIEIEGKDVVIIGRSKIVGSPLSKMMMNENATVTICFSKTKDLARHTMGADILISAAGVPHLITEDMVKEGSVIIDVGVSRIDGKIVGDVDFKNIEPKVSWITPNPGGVGPMTIVSLLNNLVKIIDNKPDEI
ncbi:bifunctional 5,10-methylenetetrahydrofolate dehydrogenase/5,10-methenyltetrahydrofolate cyclohydrolase [Mycoplasma todarodis]|uniref:Bifunctional protein FolD n=1 Tax=Mycoplasma todarodis TaxID=1937191 RepID=A0A4R0XKV3_9MOLU|nr:tetrahydrofolate dehydrogenase/cyclohydrolase catalytic domain-containing protein [Mycoplasma todarodis]TCG11094.1 bifunctional methylenetetrahydrofolate dehydrogenase/methenyltetrahydrofolate cyclohydrolase [Mycoplasma todarodis]